MSGSEPVSSDDDALECFMELLGISTDDEVSTLTCFIRELIDAKTKYSEAEAELIVKNGSISGYNMQTKYKPIKN